MVNNISLDTHTPITFPKALLWILNGKMLKPINKIGIIFYGLVMPAAPA
jgi:hypothetical protein